MVQIKRQSKRQLAKQQASQLDNQNQQEANQQLANELYTLRTKLVQALQQRAKDIVDQTSNEAQAKSLLDKGIPAIDVVGKKLLNGDSLQVNDLTGIIEYSTSTNDFQLLIDLVQYAHDRGSLYQEHLNGKQDRAFEKLRPFGEREDNRIKAVVKGQQTRADSHARGLMPFFADMEGRSLREIADKMNQQNIACSKKGSQWYPSSVKIVRDRIKELQALDGIGDPNKSR